MKKVWVDAVFLLRLMRDEGIALDVLMRVTDHINRHSSNRLLTGKANQNDLDKVRKCVNEYLKSQPKQSEKAELVSQRQRNYMPLRYDKEARQRNPKLKRMMKTKYFERYDKSASVYKFYIERDNVNPIKRHCLQMMKDPMYLTFFKNERQMQMLTRRFYLRSIITVRQINTYKKILEYYSKYYATK